MVTNAEKHSSKILYTATKNDSDAVSRRRKQHICSPIGDKIPARLVLYFLSWSGFLVSFMMRNDINFALVAMTRSHNATAATNVSLAATTIATISVPISNVSAAIAYDINATTTSGIKLDSSASGISNSTLQFIGDSLVANMSTQASIAATTAPTHIPIVKVDTLNNHHKDKDMYQYDWSTATKSVIISSFYWFYVISQVVGGVATQYFGTKHVFGWSQFATAFCSVCIPAAAEMHYVAVIILRSIQGFASGLTWPAMYAAVGPWIPLAERSRFMSSFQGFSIGIGLTYPLCGFLIDKFGWRYVFYMTGSLGMLWSLSWYLLAFDTPQSHPRISEEELEYIEANVSSDVKESLGMRVPWKSILTSMPAWSIGITTFGRIWIHYIFIVCGPNFMKNILHFDYKANGLLSGMPFICSYISSVFFCYAADKMILHNTTSLTNVRKIFTMLSQVVPGLLLSWIGYVDENITLLLVIWFIAVSLITASYAGAMANIVDIAPNLAGPVLAFAQTIHMSASFLSPLASGFIVTNESSIDQWRTVFGISTVVAFLTYIIFQIYGTAEVQPWNYARPEDNEALQEMQSLKKPTIEPISKVP